MQLGSQKFVVRVLGRVPNPQLLPATRPVLLQPSSEGLRHRELD